MNLDTEQLKIRTLDDFKKQDPSQTVTIVEARFIKYQKRRMQALAILKVRMDDIREGESYVQTLSATPFDHALIDKNKYIPTAPLTLEFN